LYKITSTRRGLFFWGPAKDKKKSSLPSKRSPSVKDRKGNLNQKGKNNCIQREEAVPESRWSVQAWMIDEKRAGKSPAASEVRKKGGDLKEEQ